MHDCRRARTLRVVWRFGLQEFRVGQNDAQLIVQTVKEGPKIARIWGIRAIFVHCFRGAGSRG